SCQGVEGIPIFCTFSTFLPGLHPSASFALFCQVCTLLPGLHPSARFAPFCQDCTFLTKGIPPGKAAGTYPRRETAPVGMADGPAPVPTRWRRVSCLEHRLRNWHPAWDSAMVDGPGHIDSR